MAIAISEPVAEVANTANQDTYSTGSYTPTANALQVVLIAATGTNVDNGVTGGGMTWRNAGGFIGTAVYAIYWAQADGAPGATTVTFDSTGGTPSGCMMAVFEVTGHNANNPINQTATLTGLGATAPTLTFPANLKTANGYAAFAINLTNTASTSGIVGPLNWTETANIAFNTPTTGMQAGYRAAGETTDTITWAGVSATAWRTFGVEINEASNGNEHPYAPEPQRAPVLAQ